MTFTVTMMNVGEVDPAVPHARYSLDTQEYFIWPEGMGQGPLIVVSRRDWDVLVEAAKSALKTAVSLKDYAATEGNGYE